MQYVLEGFRIKNSVVYVGGYTWYMSKIGVVTYGDLLSAAQIRSS